MSSAPADVPGCPKGLEPATLDVAVQDPTAFMKEQSGLRSLDILVRGARCGACLAKIEGGVGALPGVESARLNLSTGRLRVEWRGSLQAQRVMATVTGLGYSASAFDVEDAEDDRRKDERRLLVALAVAGFAAGNVMLLSVSVWAGADEMSHDTRTLLHWISALIAIPVVAFSGRPFFESALASAKARKLNMDVPVSLAVVLAIGMSLYQTVNGAEHAYFDAAVTLLFFLLIGRFLDARLRRRAWASANAMAGMQAASVTRLDESSRAEAVKASEVKPGDVLLLAAGERLAVNAEVLDGESDVDLRMVTGEMQPVPSFPGQQLHAGAVNLLAALRVKATSAASDSLLADISRMLEAGEQKKSAYRKLADKAAEAYVPRVHALALLGFVGWLIAGASLEHAAFVAVTVLIITCPCAMALAAPVVQVVAAGRLFREGAYLASGDALERIATVDHVIFDKTGTLTLGDLVYVPGGESREEIEWAARLARASRHPSSRALARAAGAGAVADSVREHAGMGVSGIVDGAPARLGSATFVGVRGQEHSARIWFRRGDDPAVAFRFTDVVRPDAQAAIARLGAMGITTEIISGDSPDRVEAIATRVGIENWTAGATPQAKANRLADMQASGKRVMMVGDGLNDAGALAQAHASLATGGAVDVSRLASDCVFAGESLGAVTRIIDIARAARGRMRENFGFATLYNLVAVPIALAGLATPMVAAIAMSASSIVVTLNALRLSHAGPGTRRGAP